MGNYRNKYHNRRVCGYDSAKEARRAEELRLLQLAGEISDLREQVSFELIPSLYTDSAGVIVESPGDKPVSRYTIHKRGLWCQERCCSYVADFVYVDTATGETVVEDVKSPATRTPEYRIKRKLMLWRHGIAIKEV